jgi:hypothetical protein
MLLCRSIQASWLRAERLPDRLPVRLLALRSSASSWPSLLSVLGSVPLSLLEPSARVVRLCAKQAPRPSGMVPLRLLPCAHRSQRISRTWRAAAHSGPRIRHAAARSGAQRRAAVRNGASIRRAAAAQRLSL